MSDVRYESPPLVGTYPSAARVQRVGALSKRAHALIDDRAADYGRMPVESVPLLRARGIRNSGVIRQSQFSLASYRGNAGNIVTERTRGHTNEYVLRSRPTVGCECANQSIEGVSARASPVPLSLRPEVSSYVGENLLDLLTGERRVAALRGHCHRRAGAPVAVLDAMQEYRVRQAQNPAIPCELWRSRHRALSIVAMTRAAVRHVDGASGVSRVRISRGD